jgi:hypothetical protein
MVLYVRKYGAAVQYPHTDCGTVCQGGVRVIHYWWHTLCVCVCVCVHFVFVALLNMSLTRILHTVRATAQYSCRRRGSFSDSHSHSQNGVPLSGTHSHSLSLSAWNDTLTAIPGYHRFARRAHASSTTVARAAVCRSMPAVNRLSNSRRRHSRRCLSVIPRHMNMSTNTKTLSMPSGNIAVDPLVLIIGMPGVGKVSDCLHSTSCIAIHSSIGS